MEEIEKLRKENKELKEELEMIEVFYGENSLIKRIKFYIKYIKEKRKNANNTICNNSTGNTWNNEINNLFNNEKIKEEK